MEEDLRKKKDEGGGRTRAHTETWTIGSLKTNILTKC
jgi:hypothetical protein